MPRRLSERNYKVQNSASLGLLSSIETLLDGQHVFLSMISRSDFQGEMIKGAIAVQENSKKVN